MNDLLSGEEVISALQKKLRISTLSELAARLGVTSQSIQTWKGRPAVSARQIAELVDRAQAQAKKDAHSTALCPIVEFCPIERAPSRSGATQNLFSTMLADGNSHPYRSGLKAELENSRGVYIFFDSRGRAIYVGKAKDQSLWKEASLAFNRDRGDLQKMRRVKHPVNRIDYKGAAEYRRQIIEVQVRMHEIAHYFSAYQVAPTMIGMVEAMLVRSFANDLLNKKMERFPGSGTNK